MEKINKLSLPATILIASVILGGFYYLAEVSKQKSIEQQQEIKIANDNMQQTRESFQKSLCSEQAKENAISSNKTRCDQGDAACIKGVDGYLVGQYENYYNLCLQSKGLK